MKTKFTLKRLADGEHGVFDGDQQAGTVDHKVLMDYAKACMEESAANLSTRPLTSGGGSLIDFKVMTKTREVMREFGLTSGKALKKVLAIDPALAQKYHAAHKREIGETG